MVMEKQEDIPCANCELWKQKEKKFLCNPDDCKILTEWFFVHAPQLKAGRMKVQMQVPEVSMQYVV